MNRRSFLRMIMASAAAVVAAPAILSAEEEKASADIASLIRAKARRKGFGTGSEYFQRNWNMAVDPVNEIFRPVAWRIGDNGKITDVRHYIDGEFVSQKDILYRKRRRRK